MVKFQSKKKILKNFQILVRKKVLIKLIFFMNIAYIFRLLAVLSWIMIKFQPKKEMLKVWNLKNSYLWNYFNIPGKWHKIFIKWEKKISRTNVKFLLFTCRSEESLYFSHSHIISGKVSIDWPKEFNERWFSSLYLVEELV